MVHRRVAPLVHAVVLAAALAVTPGNPASAADTTPLATVLGLDVPSQVRDGSSVTVAVTWSRAEGDPGAAPSGRVALDFQRLGTAVWQQYGSVDVIEGSGRTKITPRDDGQFRVRQPGSAEHAAAESAAVVLDNVPTRRLTLRVGQFNLPGPDKLARATTRAKRAAALVRRADLDVMVLNEAVGPGVDSPDNVPSSFAAYVQRSLGSQWRLITPTTRYNENYLAYRVDRLAVISRYPDRIVPGVGTGEVRRYTARHVTVALLKDLRSNQPVLVAGTHLVNNDRIGALEQSRTVAQEAISRSSGYPTVVAGDMNTAEQLPDLVASGMKDARRAASKRSAPTYATFRSYRQSKPRKDLFWIIDRIYVPSTWSVSQWTTVLDTRKGRFVQPRASDHALVWTVARSPS